MQDVTTKHKLSADAVVAYNYAYATSEKKLSWRLVLPLLHRRTRKNEKNQKFRTTV